jgi:hypothetical protein
VGFSSDGAKELGSFPIFLCRVWWWDDKVQHVLFMKLMAIPWYVSIWFNFWMVWNISKN